MRQMNYVLFLLILVLSVQPSVSQSSKIEKSNNTKNIKGETFYIHTAKRGQELEDISEAYEVPERLIAFYNTDVFVNRSPVGLKLKIPKEWDSNQTYFYHEKKRNQSFYYISKKYNIPLDKLFDLNPGLRDDNSEKKRIKIPVEKTVQGDQTRDTLYYYEVRNDKESLYDIAKKFKVSLNKLIDANQGTMWYVDKGDSLAIPKSKTEIEKLSGDSMTVANERESRKSVCDYEYSGEKFRIALLFPFHKERNSLSDSAFVAKKKINLHSNTENFLQYYQGILMAVDSMRKQGLSVNFYSYDTQNSESRVKEILNRPALKTMDLIVGPAYTKNFKIAAEFAKKYKIPAISPLSRKTEYLDKNRYAIKVKPDRDALIANMAGYMTKYWKSNYLVIHNNAMPERMRLKVLRDKMIDEFMKNRRIDDIAYNELNINDAGVKSIEPALKKEKDNIVIIPSTNETFVTNVINQLHVLFEDYNIVVYGMDEWQEFRGANLEYFHELQVHICDFLSIDYKKSHVKHFIKRFRKICHAEPKPLSYEAFDMMYYVLKTMKKYGPNVHRCLPNADFDYNKVTDFKFSPIDSVSGLENNGCSLIRYNRDFSTSRVDESKRFDYFKFRPDTFNLDTDKEE